MIYPPCAARYFLERRRHGAEVREQTAVAALQAGAVQLRDGSRWQAQRIVNATGTWARIRLLGSRSASARAIWSSPTAIRGLCDIN